MKSPKHLFGQFRLNLIVSNRRRDSGAVTLAPEDAEQNARVKIPTEQATKAWKKLAEARK